MTTRCQVGFYWNDRDGLEEPEVLLYRHFDGSPKDVLPSLKSLVNAYVEIRKYYEPTFCSAYILTSWVNEVEEPSMGTGGLGISRKLQGDLSYYYAIFGENDVRVYSFPKDPSSFSTMRRISVRVGKRK